MIFEHFLSFEKVSLRNSRISNFFLVDLNGVVVDVIQDFYASLDFCFNLGNKHFFCEISVKSQHNFILILISFGKKVGS